ncbi:MAG: SO2930 family diheme c-type cytochrome [Caulobacterales bacterium]
MVIGRFLIVLLALLGLLSCAAAARMQPTFHAQSDPALLSEWGMVQVGAGRLAVGEGVVAYQLNTALFSDYAQKFRTVWLPEGESAPYTADGAFDFPVGTVVTKTFYYPQAEDGGQVLQTLPAQTVVDATGLALAGMRLIETRVLVRRQAGWQAAVYLWNDAQTDATLKRSGGRVDLRLMRDDGREEAFIYAVPNVTQCAACHASQGGANLHPIGLQGRHVNRDGLPGFEGPAGQIERLVAVGYLRDVPGADLPAAAPFEGAHADVAAQARAYLDINCAHCHNPRGPADTSGLYLDAASALGPAFGVCKPPVAAGAGTGDLRFDVVPGAPDQSILLHRLLSDKSAEMMPEIGRALAHEEGAALISAWIAQMPGQCGG